MAELLLIDIGNTQIKWVIVKNHVWQASMMINTDDFSVELLKKAMFQHDPQQVIVSSVVPSKDLVVSAVFPQSKFIDCHSIPELKIIPSPQQQIGADRLVNAYAVWKIYGGPAIICDLGTAVTFCALSAKGEYLGGAIAPGVNLALRSLHDYTAKLPLINFQVSRKVIGENTEEALASGVFFGFLGLLERLMKEFQQSLVQDSQVVMTGGLAKIFKPYLSSSIIWEEDLVLKGLEMLVSQSASFLDF